MKKILNLIIFFIIIISGQSSYSKPIPPGSGAGDVPANILFLLDTSDSMNLDLTNSTNSVQNATDLVQLSDGNLIIAEGSKLIKMFLDDAIKDTSFAGGIGGGNFKGYNPDTNCLVKNSKLRNIEFLEISNKVKGYTGDVIFALEENKKIVMINSSGVCLDVMYSSDLHSRDPHIRAMEIKTIDDEDHLFVVGRGNGGINKPASRSYLYTKNLTTGKFKECFQNYNSANSIGVSNTISTKMKRVRDIAVDDGKNIYLVQAHNNTTENGIIHRYPLTKDADGNYCADQDASDYGYKVAITNHHSHVAAGFPLSDCIAVDKHCSPERIDIDPDNPSIMYVTTGRYGVVQKLEIKSTELKPMEISNAGRWKGDKFSNIPTVSDETVHFKKTYGIHVTSTHVWIMDTKPSIQYFEKDGSLESLTWAGNFAPTIRRIDGAINAIKAVVTDSSFASGANFGYGYWNSGVGDNPGRETDITDSEFLKSGYYCHAYDLLKHGAPKCPHCNPNCDYFHGWTGSHPVGTSTLCNVNSCLKVGVQRDGHNKIVEALYEANLAFGTDANAFSDLALDYFSDPNVDVIDPTALDCQLNYVIVITDGEWLNHLRAKPKIEELRNNNNVKTLVVAYGTDFSTTSIGRDGLSAVEKMEEMAIAGSCDDASGTAEECESYIEAATPEDLKTQLASKVQQIIADKLSFTAPSITATIQEGGSLYQAQFNYVQHGEWEGTILRKTLNPDGTVNHDPDAPGNWDAAKEIKAQPSRNIWTVLPEVSYIGDWNNFKTENSTYINTLFNYTGNRVLDYHNSSSTCGGDDYFDDDIDGLINFVRGQDYFAYNGCDNINNQRDHVLGDIYHSQLVEVGPPSANLDFTSPNDEAYWRVTNNYQAFVSNHASRKNIIYAGANDGMLHAIDSETGKEEWAFLPPFIVSELPTIMNPSLDGKIDGGNGGSNAFFGVDGSPAIHDVFIKGYDKEGNLETTKNWHTILMIPYGRGGAGFSILDVTHTLLPGTKGPLHIVSVLNDAVNSRVLIADKDGTISHYSYVAAQYKLAQSKEAGKAEKNQSAAETAGTEDNPSTFACESDADVGGNFYQLSDNTCYKGNTFTFKFTAPSTNVNKYNIFKTNLADGSKTILDLVSITPLAGGLTRITLGAPEVYNASDSAGSLEKTSYITIELDDSLTGVQDHDYKYDYSKLGETWSTPRIFRMPLSTVSASDSDQDKYVAVMGGGYGSSQLFIINLEGENFSGSTGSELAWGTIAGSLENNGAISILDSDDSNITNAIVNTPIVITPEVSSTIPWRGAMVYVNDLEGKITKINLSNSTKNSAELYEQTTLFKLNSSIDNGRYSYFSMDATMGTDSNVFWLYGGTGDFQRVNDVEDSMDNILFGIKDFDYPYFKSNLKVPIQNNDGWEASAAQNINLAPNIDDNNICKDTTITEDGVACPVETTDSGWVVHLDDLANNKYRKLTGVPTVYSGRVYFPIYKPPDGGNRCSLGKAYICSDDDECGTNKSPELAEMEGATMDGEEDPCFAVGPGILSELVVFGGTLYGNVAGPSENEDTLITILADKDDVNRSNKQSWRQLGF